MENTNNRSENQIMTAAGLFLSLVAPTVITLLIRPYYLSPALEANEQVLVGNGLVWLTVLLVLLIVRFGERLPLKSIGWEKISRKWVWAAIGIGIGLMLLSGLIQIIAGAFIQQPESGTLESVTTNLHWWVLLYSVISTSFTEEILFRGFILERLISLTRNPWLSAVISMTAFVFAHLGQWNIVHVIIVVIPFGAIMTALYLWKRNLPFVIIIHTLINLPLVFLASG